MADTWLSSSIPLEPRRSGPRPRQTAPSSSRYISSSWIHRLNAFDRKGSARAPTKLTRTPRANAAANLPKGGSLYIFSRQRCRSFRADQHSWRKKNDNKTIKETHEKLKVADEERLNCYYAHAESTDGLQRRCYWILDKQYDDTVMVHYLCAKTSRAMTASKGPGPHVKAKVRSRPRRAASLKASFSNLYSSDSEEMDTINKNAAIGLADGTGQGRLGVAGPSGNANGDKGDEDADDLGDPLDSFMAKLPDDLGTFGSRELLLESIPDDLSITHEQLSKMLQGTSPGKAQELSFGLSGLISGVSIGKEDLLGLINDGLLMTSPQGEKKKGQPSRQLASDAENLLRGFSRLESMEFLKMVAPDFPNLASGVSEDKTGIADDGKGKEEDRVSTIRRVVAPASASGLSHFQNLAGAAVPPSHGGTVGSDQGMGNARKMLVNPMATKEHAKSKADIAKDKANFNLQRRESLLRKVRNKNEFECAETNDSGDLIVPSNVLFRSSSHLMEKGETSPEKARALLKTMSIDDPLLDDSLPASVFSAEMKPGAPGDASPFESAMDSGPDSRTTE